LWSQRLRFVLGEAAELHDRAASTVFDRRTSRMSPSITHRPQQLGARRFVPRGKNSCATCTSPELARAEACAAYRSRGPPAWVPPHGCSSIACLRPERWLPRHANTFRTCAGQSASRKPTLSRRQSAQKFIRRRDQSLRNRWFPGREPRPGVRGRRALIPASLRDARGKPAPQCWPRSRPRRLAESPTRSAVISYAILSSRCPPS